MEVIQTNLAHAFFFFLTEKECIAEIKSLLKTFKFNTNQTPQDCKTSNLQKNFMLLIAPKPLNLTAENNLDKLDKPNAH